MYFEKLTTQKDINVFDIYVSSLIGDHLQPTKCGKCGHYLWLRPSMSSCDFPPVFSKMACWKTSPSSQIEFWDFPANVWENRRVITNQPIRWPSLTMNQHERHQKNHHENHHENRHWSPIIHYESRKKKNMGLDPRATSGVRMLDDLRPSNHQMLCSSQINWIWNHVWSTCNQWDHLKSSNSKTYTHLDHSRSIAHAPRLQNHLKQSASIIQTYATWCDMTTHAKSCKIN